MSLKHFWLWAIEVDMYKINNFWTELSRDGFASPVYFDLNLDTAIFNADALT